MPVVVLLVLGEDPSGVRLAHDQNVVENLAANGPDHSFAVSVHLRSPGRAEEHLHLLASKTASKEPVYLLSRSRRTKRNDSTWRPSSLARLRAYWVAHCAVGCAATPVMWSLRVRCSRNASAYKRLPVIVSTWKKSAAMIPSPCPRVPRVRTRYPPRPATRSSRRY